MMNKHKIKKPLILLILFTSIFILNYKSVYAHGGSMSSSGGSGGDFSAHTGNDSRKPSYGSSCDSVICAVSYSYTQNVEAEVDIKDMYGNRIEGDVFESTISKEFLAGTYIMLRVYEKQSFTATASYRVSAKRQVWTCEYIDISQGKCLEYNYCNYSNVAGPVPCGCKVYEQVEKTIAGPRDEDCVCSGSADKIKKSFKGWRDVTSEYADSCSASANPQESELNPLYIASYKDSNDVNAGDNTGTATKVEGHECSEPVRGTTDGTTDRDGIYSSANTLSGECSVSYDREATICINVKTGKVRYIDGNNNGQCGENEYKVLPDEDGYWKYFIPLNANSAEDFSFELETSGNTLPDEICQDYKNNYPYWQNIITMAPGGGCYLETTVTIPIKQQFYNEIVEGNTFKEFYGFNFYYKPIDINDPFPNNLTNTSIWYDWLNNNNNKEPDLEDSFNEITYYTKTLNGNSIRNYNKDNKYTSWSNMNINGTSKYISSEGVVSRNFTPNKNSFYKLGCGPKNTNVNNAFQQKECNT